MNSQLRDPACDSDSFKRFLKTNPNVISAIEVLLTERAIQIHVLLYFTSLTNTKHFRQDGHIRHIHTSTLYVPQKTYIYMFWKVDSVDFGGRGEIVALYLRHAGDGKNYKLESTQRVQTSAENFHVYSFLSKGIAI